MSNREWVPKVGDEVKILEWVGVVGEVRTFEGRTKVRVGDQDYTLDDLRPADEPSVDLAALKADILRRLELEYREPREQMHHGSCCCCADCGHYHDECVCVDNEQIAAIRAAFEAVTKECDDA